MSAVAVEAPAGFERRLRQVPAQPTAPDAVARPLETAAPSPTADVEPWELHSELALVCPEVRARALEFLPDADSDVLLARRDGPIALPPMPFAEREPGPDLAGLVLRYALWRAGETARCALIAAGGLVALASLAELLH
jgi:hypothetical protein